MCKSEAHQNALYRELRPHFEEVIRQVAAMGWHLGRGENACHRKEVALAPLMSEIAGVATEVLDTLDVALGEKSKQDPSELRGDLIVEGLKLVAPESRHAEIDEEMAPVLDKLKEMGRQQFRRPGSDPRMN